MLKKILFFIFLTLSIWFTSAQTTDLSVIAEVQDLSNNPVSQVTIYEEFQYVVTIINSGGSVSNSTISIQLDQDVIVNTFVSQNNSGSASDVSNFNLSTENILTGAIADMPNNSSVEILINVNAPTEIGGIALSATVMPPDAVSDSNASNNTSIISIDIIDAIIDFTVTHSQISPAQGTPISAWDDTITYQFTITNNSVIDFPLDGFFGNLSLLSSTTFGTPNVDLLSIECLSATNGTACIDTSMVLSGNLAITSMQSVFSYNIAHEFTAGGSLTFEVVYQYLEPNCAEEIQSISVESYIQISLSNTNISSNESNRIEAQLLEAELCPFVDICINTEQLNPTPGTAIDYYQTVTFETVVCNNGPIDAPIRFFLQNLAIPPAWNVTSLNCISTTGSITCDDIILTIDGQLWKSSDFTIPANSTITIISEFEFLEPSCSTNNNAVEGSVRSAINIIDTVPENNLDNDTLILPSGEPCPSADLSVSKTQINPITNPAPWGEVTYEITVFNSSAFDAVIDLRDYMPNDQNEFVTAILVDVICVSTTGTASCFDILHSNIGVVLDGEPQNGEEDVFWKISTEDNWELPAESSVTFEVTVDWSPECSDQAILSTNAVEVNYVNDIIDTDADNNSAFATTAFAPCIDLIVQTYPEFTQIGVNQSFDWVIDISNSTTSSEAIDVVFENTLNNVFSILETPTCMVINGDATCVTNFTTSNNLISGIIPSMSSGSTVQIRIPVLSPSFGGAFNNIAEAIVSSTNNEELTPETNLSISNIQIVAPVVTKVFDPEIILAGEQSLLTFTITNLASNPEQNDISFLDNLPDGLFLAGAPFWESTGNNSGDFIGFNGDATTGISNFAFEGGNETATFSVLVTSNIAGAYTNDFSNFSDTNNVDTSQANASLTVNEGATDVDIEISKTASVTESFIGGEVTFTITATNLGTTTASAVEIIEQLPAGYAFIAATVTSGVFDENIYSWLIDSLAPNTTETLTLNVSIISSENLLNVAFINTINQTDTNIDNDQSSASVTISDCLKIPEGISPNNDGKNDVLIISCIDSFPDNFIQIYKRYGALVYQKNNYENNWNGLANTGIFNTSELLPVGTYFYVVELGDTQKPLSGYIYLNY